MDIAVGTAPDHVGHPDRSCDTRAALIFPRQGNLARSRIDEHVDCRAVNLHVRVEMPVASARRNLKSQLMIKSVAVRFTPAVTVAKWMGAYAVPAPS